MGTTMKEFLEEHKETLSKIISLPVVDHSRPITNYTHLQDKEESIKIEKIDSTSSSLIHITIGTNMLEFPRIVITEETLLENIHHFLKDDIGRQAIYFEYLLPNRAFFKKSKQAILEGLFQLNNISTFSKLKAMIWALETEDLQVDRPL